MQLLAMVILPVLRGKTYFLDSRTQFRKLGINSALFSGCDIHILHHAHFSLTKCGNFRLLPVDDHSARTGG